MNLHAYVSPYISAVNPMTAGNLFLSEGFTQLSGGRREPKFSDAIPVRIQVQALSYKDLIQIDATNQNGTRRAMYLYGKVQGINRAENKGGDIVEIATGDARGKWLVVQVTEQWPGWVKVVVTLQMPD